MNRRAVQVIALTALLLAAAQSPPPAAHAAPDADNPDEVPLINAPPDDDPVAAAPAPSTADDAPDDIPLPPAAPRIASGPDYEACLDQLATDPAAAARTATAWRAHGGGAGAAHCLALATVALGRPADGAAALDRLAQDSHADAAARATVYGQAGQAWRLAANPAAAAASATAALALTPDDPDALIDRAHAEADENQLKPAIADLDAALQIEPKRADAIITRAADRRRLDQLDAAADDVNRVLAQDPDDPDALLERGVIRQRQGNLAGARADWEQASNLAPDTATGDLARQDLDLLEAGPQK